MSSKSAQFRLMEGSTRVLSTIWVGSLFRCHRQALTKLKYKTCCITLNLRLSTSMKLSLPQARTLRHSFTVWSTGKTCRQGWRIPWFWTRQVGSAISSRKHHLTRGPTPRTPSWSWSASPFSWANWWRASTQRKWRRLKRIRQMQWRICHSSVSSNEWARNLMLNDFSHDWLLYISSASVQRDVLSSAN